MSSNMEIKLYKYVSWIDSTILVYRRYKTRSIILCPGEISRKFARIMRGQACDFPVMISWPSNNQILAKTRSIDSNVDVIFIIENLPSNRARLAIRVGEAMMNP